MTLFRERLHKPIANAFFAEHDAMTFPGERVRGFGRERCKRDLPQNAAPGLSGSAFKIPGLAIKALGEVFIPLSFLSDAKLVT